MTRTRVKGLAWMIALFVEFSNLHPLQQLCEHRNCRSLTFTSPRSLFLLFVWAVKFVPTFSYTHLTSYHHRLTILSPSDFQSAKMKSSLILAASGALMASASPVLQDRRLHLTTLVVEEWVTVTVIAPDMPVATANAFKFLQHGPGRPVFSPHPQEASTTTVQPTSQAPAPVPTPSSSSIVVAAPPPAPETTSSTVIIVPVSSSTQQPAPTTAPAVVAAPPAATSTQQEPATTKVDSPAAPSAPSSSDYASTLLYHHNIHRSNHSAGAMTWGETYAQYAQEAAAGCKFQHDL